MTAPIGPLSTSWAVIATTAFGVWSFCSSAAMAQTASSLAARDAFTASLSAALPPLSLRASGDISVRYGATKYYEFEALQQTVAVSAVIPFTLQSKVGLTLGTSSPDCAGCPRWFLAGIDYGRRVGPLPRVQATASLATGFQNLARSATSIGVAIPIEKMWSRGFAAVQAGIAASGVTTIDVRAHALRPTTAVTLGWRTRRMALAIGGQAVLFTARPPVAGVTFSWLSAPVERHRP